MKRHTRTASIVAAAGIVASTFLVAAPASAGVYQCSAGYACGWYDPDYQGAFWQRTGNYAHLSGEGVEDEFSAISNRRTSQITWFAMADYWGYATTQQPGATWGNLWGTVYNDAYSSIKTGT